MSRCRLRHRTTAVGAPPAADRTGAGHSVRPTRRGAAQATTGARSGTLTDRCGRPAARPPRCRTAAATAACQVRCAVPHARSRAARSERAARATSPAAIEAPGRGTVARARARTGSGACDGEGWCLTLSCTPDLSPHALPASVGSLREQERHEQSESAVCGPARQPWIRPAFQLARVRALTPAWQPSTARPLRRQVRGCR